MTLMLKEMHLRFINSPISHTDLANSVDIVIGREPSPNVITIDKINRALDFARESAKYIADETN